MTHTHITIDNYYNNVVKPDLDVAIFSTDTPLIRSSVILIEDNSLLTSSIIKQVILEYTSHFIY